MTRGNGEGVVHEASCHYRGIISYPFAVSLSFFLLLPPCLFPSLPLNTLLRRLRVCMYMPNLTDALESRWCARWSACRWMHALLPSSTLLEVSLGLSEVQPSADRRVYQSGLRTPRPSYDPLLRASVTYTSAVHARPRPTRREIIFRVIFRAQTKLEWMQNTRK